MWVKFYRGISSDEEGKLGLENGTNDFHCHGQKKSLHFNPTYTDIAGETRWAYATRIHQGLVMEGDIFQLDIFHIK